MAKKKAATETASTKSEAPAEEKPKKTAKKAPAKKTAEKKAAAAPALAPMIDTGNAARVAANLVGKKVQTETGAPAKKPSSAFQQMKDNLNKPHSTVMGNLLGDIQGKRATGHQGFAKQVGHNQTFGANVTRTGVPRRTAG